MELKGVEPLKLNKKGLRTTFYFITPYSDKLLNSHQGWKRYLKSLGKTPSDFILDLNNLDISDLPLCVVCKKNHVRLGGGPNCTISLLKPKLLDSCDNKSCKLKVKSTKSVKTQMKLGTHNLSNLDYETRSKVSSNSLKNWWNSLTKDQRSLEVSKRNRKKVENGTHHSQSPEFYLTQRKVSRNALINGNHPSQTHGHIYELIDGDEVHFKSRAELRVYKRYKEFLNKYYVREKLSSLYRSSRRYSADYSLVDNTVDLPDFIEVKSGNLFWDQYHGNLVKSINYDKFKSVVDDGKTILIIDDYKGRTNSYQKFHYIRCINDLNELFRS